MCYKLQSTLASCTHLTTNEDEEEKKLTTYNMQLQEWYDDYNEDYDEYELKAAIKEDHDSRVSTEDGSFHKRTEVRLHCTTTQRRQADEMGCVITTRCAAEMSKSKVNLDEIYATTPAAITLRMLLTLAQLRHHSVYMSDIQSAFLNTPVQPGTTLLVKPPPECETNDDILWKLSKQLYELHRGFSSTCRQYSNNLVYDS
eukprot:588007-Amphidinium_carterae.4